MERCIGSSFSLKLLKYFNGISLARYPKMREKKPIATQMRCCSRVRGVHLTA